MRGVRVIALDRPAVIKTLVHSARSLPFVGIPDLPRAIGRSQRALRPGGVLSCHVFGPAERWRRPEAPGMIRGTRTSPSAEIFEVVARRPVRRASGRPARRRG